MAKRECKNAREFGDIFRQEVSRRGSGWTWRRDLKPWLASALDGVKFGDPRHDWSPDAAREMGREFIAEASTW